MITADSLALLLLGILGDALWHRHLSRDDVRRHLQIPLRSARRHCSLLHLHLGVRPSPVPGCQKVQEFDHEEVELDRDGAVGGDREEVDAREGKRIRLATYIVDAQTDCIGFSRRLTKVLVLFPSQDVYPGPVYYLMPVYVNNI